MEDQPVPQEPVPVWPAAPPVESAIYGFKD